MPLCLRFGWQPVNLPLNLPQMYVCGKPFRVEHAFTCPYDGFPSICRNEIRDLTASLLSEVCCDVGVEPAFQPVEGEPLQFDTANGEDAASLDVIARDFWGWNRQHTFLMSGCSILLTTPIFIPNCPDVTSHMNVGSDGHMIHVLERLRELAFHHWCLQLLVAWGPATTVFRKLASMLAEKRSINYSKCLFWLLCFSLLRSSVMCLRGHHSSMRCPATTNIDLAYSEGRLESGGLD